MGSDNAEVTDDSATISDNDGVVIETDVDVKNAVDSDLPSDLSPFSQGEKVIASFNGNLYIAKGWKKNWDEWVGMDRLMKFTEEKEKEINKKQGTEKITKIGRVSQIKPRDSNVARGKKRKKHPGTKEMGNLAQEKLVNIHIPSTLKTQLIDDCELITHMGKLVKLPCSPNVDDILQKYLDHRLKKDGMISDSVGEILNGLRCYFDKALPAMLLYKSERQQYQEAIAQHVSPSTVYGAGHLLRLFVKLPEMLYYANIEEQTLKELQQKLLDFLKAENLFSCHSDSCRRTKVPFSYVLTRHWKVLMQAPRNLVIELGPMLPTHYIVQPNYLIEVLVLWNWACMCVCMVSNL
ncbi:protein MRG1-like isoform X2 [Actinidia eriantha]|uniref:protein MRG1-like isoform X2 n=1 Tax=Actinidia eriantha TaxID=165200 RepID=UPI00258D5043|nr:protein MRG1-like isoform X2 [Actinidia eriantha]